MPFPSRVDADQVQLRLRTGQKVLELRRELTETEGFVGHVGDDDFVCMSDPATIDAICRTVIKRCDLVSPDFYDREDRLRGSINSVDRKGNHEQFPLMTLSISVVTNEFAPIKHPGDISKILSQLKKQVTAMNGSFYLKDQRGNDRQIEPADSSAGLPR